MVTLDDGMDCKGAVEAFMVLAIFLYIDQGISYTGAYICKTLYENHTQYRDHPLSSKSISLSSPSP